MPYAGSTRKPAATSKCVTLPGKWHSGTAGMSPGAADTTGSPTHIDLIRVLLMNASAGKVAWTPMISRR